MSFVDTVSLILLVFFIILVGVLTFKNQKDKKEFENNPLARCYFGFTSGHTWVRIDKKINHGKVTELEVFPFDVNGNKLKNQDGKIEKYTIFPLTSHVIPLNSSDHKEDFVILPDKEEQLPIGIQESVFGTSYAKVIEEINGSDHKLNKRRKMIESMEDAEIGFIKANSQIAKEWKEFKVEQKEFNERVKPDEK